jgi:hypothetical protein
VNYLLQHFFLRFYGRYLKWRTDRWYTGLGTRFLGRPEGMLHALPEMSRFDRDEFYAKYILKSQPVVLRGFAAQWPCIGKWDLNFFAREYGNTVSLINNNRGLVRKDEEGNFERLLLKEYIAGLKKGSKRYLRFSPIILENTELMDDLDVPQLKYASGYADPRADFQLFIGGKGTYTPLHCAFPSNLFVQIMGRKKWILYKPENNLFLSTHAPMRCPWRCALG